MTKKNWMGWVWPAFFVLDLETQNHFHPLLYWSETDFACLLPWSRSSSCCVAIQWPQMREVRKAKHKIHVLFHYKDSDDSIRIVVVELDIVLPSIRLKGKSKKPTTSWILMRMTSMNRIESIPDNNVTLIQAQGTSHHHVHITYCYCSCTFYMPRLCSTAASSTTTFSKYLESTLQQQRW